MCPYRLDEICNVKFNPVLVSGWLRAKLSCSLNVLLDNTLTLLVEEWFPPKSTAYAFTVLLPAARVTVVVQLV